MDVSDKNVESIEEYLLKTLDIEIQGLDEEKKQLYLKNFIYTISKIILELREIDTRIQEYKQEYKVIENDKSNLAEYTRRKLKYFLKINEEAQQEIMCFLRDELKKYLIDVDFDAQKREEEKEELTLTFLNARYNYSFVKEYYDKDFDYSTGVKVCYLPNVDFYNGMQMEEMYIKMHQEEPAKYYDEIKKIVDDYNIMNAVASSIENNFHLNKRSEIFTELVSLFTTKSYQSFVALGLLQLEGLFYDLCEIKFGEKENHGTLTEKVGKLFSDNEISFMKYYPYFAFDVPVNRNQIAHKGIIETNELERIAYDLVLDLNAVTCIVKQVSEYKFRLARMINAGVCDLNAEGFKSETMDEELCEKLILELMRSLNVGYGDFSQVIKNPNAFEVEFVFYEQWGVYADEVITIREISKIVRSDMFWEILCKVVKKYMDTESKCDSLFVFSNQMKNEYIKELQGEAERFCVEISKVLKEKGA